MLPHDCFERSNSRQWDTESDFSVSSTAPSKGDERDHGTPTSAYHQSNSIQTFQPNTNRGTAPAQNGLGGESASGHSITRVEPAQAAARGQQQQRRGNAYNPENQRQARKTTSTTNANNMKPKNDEWAVAPGLVTTRAAKRDSEEALKKAEFDSLCIPPDSNEPFAATGYYLWPKGCGDPMTLFDPTLKIFHDLRRMYKVHIDWNDKMRCLRINCNVRGAEQNVADVMQGIKALQWDAQAKVIFASPEYIIVPPTADAMRSTVRPKSTEEREHSVNPVVTSIELAGERLSPAEKSKWESRLPQMDQENFRTFRSHLIKRTLPLRDLRGWMRMRVHLGHVNLSQYQAVFATGGYTFEMFSGMMRKTRVAAGGTFDRKMNAVIAMNLIKKIVCREQDFCPRKSTTPSLSDVVTIPKHTEIIFVATPDGQQHRLEAEIESAYVAEEGVKGKYQIGHTRLFANDRRNKRMELTTLDIQREFDWTVEIIQDGEIKEIPGTLRSYIAASLDTKSEELVDPLNLPYPAIALKAPTGFMVQNVIMRSVFQYMRINTSNIIEIAIYREWEGYSTKRAPVMQASVSIFNPDWDSEMESVEAHTEVRKWDHQLHNFFGKDGVCHKNTGLSGLIHEIREVQDLLAARI